MWMMGKKRFISTKLVLGSTEALAGLKLEGASPVLARRDPKARLKAALSRPEPEVEASSGEADEESLFFDAVRGVKPLDGARVPRSPEPKSAPASSQEPDAKSALMDLVSGKIEFSLEHLDEYVQGRVKNLDLTVFVKLKAGRFSPEGHLDLHGLNLLQAYDALVGFIKHSYQQNKRCVLLVTGRGRNSPEGFGLIKREVQTWLTRDPLKRVVLAFCTAPAKHGGMGALYVLLRDVKKGGKIVWDRSVDAFPDL